MRPEFIVAVKEFKDYMTSKRFLILFGVLVLAAIASVITGMADYNQQLSNYNANLQQAASSAYGRLTPEMPSSLIVFNSFSGTFSIIGLLLAISMGFDMITREKESGSLKLLLARPLFRDSVINGKIIGAVAMLTIVFAATFLVTIAILLFGGVVPTGDDFVRMVAFFVASLLYCLAFLAISMALSTVSKSSAMAIMLSIGIFIVSATLIPMFSDTIGDAVMGEAPEMFVPATGNSTGATAFRANVVVFGMNGSETAPMQMNPEYTAYAEKRSQIVGAINLLSPAEDFNSISSVIVGKSSSPMAGRAVGVYVSKFGESPPTLMDTLPSTLPNVLALLVMAILGFALSYVKFMRMDVR
jgi:ABC-2 type transport system permease protein